MFLFREIRTFLELKKKMVNVDKCVTIESVSCGRHVNIAHHAQISNSKIGDFTSIGRYSKVQYTQMGKFCSVSWDVTIGAIRHPMRSISTHAFSYRKLFGICDKDEFIQHDIVNIGNDVWIGCGVIILPGISIGNGAIIGAGAVVTHDVKSYEVVAGIPAKNLGYRFDREIRNELEKTNWWEFSDKVIRENLNLFSFKNDISKPSELKKLVLLSKEEGIYKNE